MSETRANSESSEEALKLLSWPRLEIYLVTPLEIFRAQGLPVWRRRGSLQTLVGKEKEDVTNPNLLAQAKPLASIKDTLRNEGDGHRSNAHVNIHPLVSSCNQMKSRLVLRFCSETGVWCLHG